MASFSLQLDFGFQQQTAVKPKEKKQQRVYKLFNQKGHYCRQIT